ncbi:MAG: CxxxxCH/CxxCH domain-containing protein [bacterium]
MKKLYTTVLIIVVSFFVLYSCSDPQDELTAVPKISIHSAGFGNPSSPDFHSKYFVENGWQLKNCIKCHGSNYTGGTTGSSCVTCHTQSDGPEACNTCHGDFSDPTNIAPPRDVMGNIATTAKGVGAHQTHTIGNTRTAAMGCYDCHTADVTEGEKYVFSHIGQLPAEILFSGLGNKTGNANYDFTSLQCSNTYCHGNFEFLKSESSHTIGYVADKMEGNKFNPVWNVVDGTQAKCGTCHGELDASGNLVTAVPKGHLPSDLINCVNCHFGIVDAQGNVTDKNKHINGERNVFGE